MILAELIDRQQEEEVSRTKRLKAATRVARERIDNCTMAAAPFSDRDRYGLFLKLQYLFHRDLDVSFGDKRLDGLLPDLA